MNAKYNPDVLPPNREQHSSALIKPNMHTFTAKRSYPYICTKC